MKNSFCFAEDFYEMQPIEINNIPKYSEVNKRGIYTQKETFYLLDDEQVIINEIWNEQEYKPWLPIIAILAEYTLEENEFDHLISLLLSKGYKVIYNLRVKEEKQIPIFIEQVGIKCWGKILEAQRIMFLDIKAKYPNSRINVVGISGLADLGILALQDIKFDIYKFIMVDAIMDYELLLKKERLQTVFNIPYYDFNNQKIEDIFRRYPELQGLNPIKVLKESEIKNVVIINTLFEGEYIYEEDFEQLKGSYNMLETINIYNKEFMNEVIECCS